MFGCLKRRSIKASACLVLTTILMMSGSCVAADTSTAEEFAALPADIGKAFLEASLGEASIKVLSVKTPQVPTERYNLVATPYKTETPDVAGCLVLKSQTGPVRPEEIEGLEKFLLDYPLPRCNIMNYYFRKFYIPWMLEWVYQRTANPALIEKAVRMAYSTAAHRNDRFGVENIGGYGPLAIWPHYRGYEWKRGKLSIGCGLASFSPLSFQTVPARMIAQRPELWDRKLDGVTYKQIALDLIRESFQSTDFVMKKCRDPETNLIREPRGFGTGRGDIIWNRTLVYMVGTVPLIDALEAFQIESERAEMLDAVNAAMLDEFFRTMRREEIDGRTVYVWLYRSNKERQGTTEGFGHGGFDLRYLEFLYQSGRYPNFTEEWVQRMADTIAFCCKGPGHYWDKLDGHTKPKKEEGFRHYRYLPALEGYIWLAPLRQEIQTNIVDYILDTLLADCLDSRAVWEILKLRESKRESTRGRS